MLGLIEAEKLVCIAAPDSVVVFSDSTEQIILTLSEENRLRGSKSVVSACLCTILVSRPPSL